MDIDWVVFGSGAGAAIIIGIACGLYKDRKRKRANQRALDEYVRKGGHLTISPHDGTITLTAIEPDQED